MGPVRVSLALHLEAHLVSAWVHGTACLRLKVVGVVLMVMGTAIKVLSLILGPLRVQVQRDV